MRKVTVLTLAAAVSPVLTPDPGIRAARLLHERGTIKGIAPHCDFRFEHCPYEACRLARDRQPGDEDR